MNERPILFSTPMVLALLAGRKTQTRRLNGLEVVNEDSDNWQLDRIVHESSPALAHFSSVDGKIWQFQKCPYGNVGDRLWVREAFAFEPKWGGTKPSLVPHSEPVYFLAGDLPRHVQGHGRPSIHLPHAFARIYLEVAEIRVERLNTISDEDAIAEGIESYQKIDEIIAYINYDPHGRKDFLTCSEYGFNHGKETHSAPVASYCTLWIDINGRDSWLNNPWVWVVKFKILSTTSRGDIPAEQEAAAV